MQLVGQNVPSGKKDTAKQSGSPEAASLPVACALLLHLGLVLPGQDFVQLLHGLCELRNSVTGLDEREAKKDGAVQATRILAPSSGAHSPPAVRRPSSPASRSAPRGFWAARTARVRAVEPLETRYRGRGQVTCQGRGGGMDGWGRDVVD